MRLLRIGSGFGLAMLMASVTFGQSVRTDYARGTDFTQYRTFMWIKAPNAVNPLNNQRIVEGVNSALTARGLKLVDSGGDLGVAAHTATEQGQTHHTFYDGFGGDWQWRNSFGSATTTVSTYTVGTLVVDIFDARSKNAVWRGTAMKTLSSNPEKVGRTITKAIARMFEAYPPASAQQRR